MECDYYNNQDNEGELAFAFMNIKDEPITIEQGEKLGQGMFIRYYDITGLDTSELEKRSGGFRKH